MKAETLLMHAIQLRASQLGARLFRNNVGMAEQGKKRKRKIRYGLCKGSSDLIGWTKDGRFIAVEVKIDTLPTKEQLAFLNAAIDAGCVAIIATSVADLERALFTGIDLAAPGTEFTEETTR